MKLTSNLENEKTNLISHKVLEKCNPQKFYYFYALKTKGFFLNKSKNQESFSICSFPVYYIVKTFYPFSSLFKNILEKYIKLKLKKVLEIYRNSIRKSSFDLNILELADDEGILHFERKLFQEISTDLLKIRITGRFGQIIQFRESLS